ncbi:hypothetical protein Tco_1236883 [Tanacetum coccineum]
MYYISYLQRARQIGSTECKERDHDVKPLEGRAYGDFKQCSMPVGRGFLHTCGGILNMIDNITSTFDGICHQTFHAAKTNFDTAESDSDDEEEYLNGSDPLDQSLALQEVLNPFRKICVWKKVVSFLGSLPVALPHVEWKPDYTRCFNKKEDSDGK